MSPAVMDRPDGIAVALAGLLACPEWEPPPGDSFAKAAYRQADDMMKERTL